MSRSRKRKVMIKTKAFNKNVAQHETEANLQPLEVQAKRSTPQHNHTKTNKRLPSFKHRCFRFIQTKPKKKNTKTEGKL